MGWVAVLAGETAGGGAAAGAVAGAGAGAWAAPPLARQDAGGGELVGPGTHYSPHNSTHFEPSFLS